MCIVSFIMSSDYNFQLLFEELLSSTSLFVWDLPFKIIKTITFI